MMRRSHLATAFQIFLALLALVACGILSSGLAEDQLDLTRLPAPASGKVDFVKQVQPIFRAKCYACHGPEAEEAGLRLDVKVRALDGGDNGPVIILGESTNSRLVHLVAELEEGERMPPIDEGTPLTGEEIALVRAWIDAGADWPADADSPDAEIRGADHWAFQPIRDVGLPQVRNPAWVRNGIDAFVLQQLEAEGVEPSPEADRSTLIRRLYLDLHGLLPSPGEVAEFLADESSDAYDQLVERLLASPHYGERWGRHWLDVARYADSDGFEKDRPRPHAWRWREWVIEAINNDMPFDQFTIEQLAGDLLPDADTSQRVATGFNRNTLINTEGGTDKEEDRVKRTVDRTNTLGEVWLGMTVECANCHTHKYDPLTQRDYFGLYAFFNSMTEPDIPAPLPEQVAEYKLAKAAFDAEHAKFTDPIKKYEQEQLPQALAEWEAAQGENLTTWTVLKPASVTSAKGAKLQTADDGAVLASGENADSDVYTLVASADLAGVTGIRLEVLPDKSLPKEGPGRSEGGNFVLAEVTVSATAENAASDGSSAETGIEFQSAAADFSQKGWDVSGAIDGNQETGWAVSPEFGKRHVAIFAAKAPIAGGSTLTVTLDHTYKAQAHNLGRFRIAVTRAAPPLDVSPFPDEIVAILSVPAGERNEKQQAELTKYYRGIDPELKKLDQSAAEHAKQAPVDPATQVKAQAIAEMSPARETKIHIRGNFLEKGAAVEPHTPPVLPPLTPRDDQPDRLDLAHWVMDPGNPLTARVTVNRILQRYFGRGLVATSHDFGTQGDPPSHPELLDWLATQFRESGWSLKSLHRLIVGSATYRQSSDARPELDERDPYNTWLARQNRVRVSAEVIRDLALDASGLLSDKVGGPSVRPPQPEGIDKLGYAGSVKWQTSTGKDRYRRGLYTFFQRTVPYPMLVTFDAPDSNTACTRRERSNTPLQSLTLWNDPVFFECAQALGRRIVNEIPASGDIEASIETRIRDAFRLCLSRDPSQDERAAVRQLYEEQLALLESDEKAANEIIGSLPQSEGTPPAELASWIMVGRTLMNLDQFITRE